MTVLTVPKLRLWSGPSTEVRVRKPMAGDRVRIGRWEGAELEPDDPLWFVGGRIGIVGRPVGNPRYPRYWVIFAEPVAVGKVVYDSGAFDQDEFESVDPMVRFS